MMKTVQHDVQSPIIIIIIIIIIMTKIIAIISIAPYHTDMGEYTALYKINTNVYIKTSKTIIM